MVLLLLSIILRFYEIYLLFVVVFLLRIIIRLLVVYRQLIVNWLLVAAGPPLSGTDMIELHCPGVPQVVYGAVYRGKGRNCYAFSASVDIKAVGGLILDLVYDFLHGALTYPTELIWCQSLPYCFVDVDR
jgi:hypothetical protein